MASIPKSLGKYVIVGPIGKGGMGEVFKAFQPDLNRHVAIKTLLAGEQASEDFLQRFQREARVAAKLVHPNIVQIHDIGAEGKLHYIVMEYVEGRSLKQVLAEKKLDPESALRIAHSIARALKFAHDQKIIHRDIKPANILIDKQGRVRILDFGLAKSLADGKALTMSSVMIGTPCYMSPEQAFAAPEEVDARTDLYSLGAVLFEMLTGRPPFQGATVLAILRKIEEEDPPPAGISREVDALVEKALSKDPDRRFQSASEIADAIKSCLAGGVTEVVPAPTSRTTAETAPTLVRPRFRMNRLGAVLGAGGLLAVGLVAWVASRPAEEAPAAPPPPPKKMLSSTPPDPASRLRALFDPTKDVLPEAIGKFAEDPQLRRIIAQEFQKRGQFSRAFEYLKGYERAICDLASARSLQRFVSPALFRLSIQRPRDLTGSEQFLMDAIARHLEGKQELARLKLKNAEYAHAAPEHVLLVRAYIDLWDVWLDPGGEAQRGVLGSLRADLDRNDALLLLPLRAIVAQVQAEGAPSPDEADRLRKKAREFANRFKKSAPFAAESFLLSAILFQQAGLIDLATEELETAVRYDPKNVDLSIYRVYLRWLEVLNDPQNEKIDVKSAQDVLGERLKHDHYPAALFLRAVGNALESKWWEADEDLRRLEKRAPLDRITVDHERLSAFIYAGQGRSKLLDAAAELQIHLGRADQGLKTSEQITGDDLVEEEKVELLRRNHLRIARLAVSNEPKALGHIEEALKLGALPEDLKKEESGFAPLQSKRAFQDLLRAYRENHRAAAKGSLENEETALHHLEEALKLGLPAKELVEDAELGQLREKPAFRELVKRYEDR